MARARHTPTKFHSTIKVNVHTRTATCSTSLKLVSQFPCQEGSARESKVAGISRLDPFTVECVEFAGNSGRSTIIRDAIRSAFNTTDSFQLKNYATGYHGFLRSWPHSGEIPAPGLEIGTVCRPCHNALIVARLC